MHLVNGGITPECAVLAFGASAGGLAAAAWAERASIRGERLLMAGAAACLTLGVQAINVPVAPGFSGHLVGGVLLASLLGPGLAAWTMSLVLLVQAALLGDGGMASLGANILNMALLPAGLVALSQRSFARFGSPSSISAISGVAVLLAAVLIVAETALFRSANNLAGLSDFAGRMIVSHLWIGLLEGAATFAVLQAHSAVSCRTSLPRPAVVAIAAAAFVALALLPISSSLPDGYEAAAQASGMAWLLK